MKKNNVFFMLIIPFLLISCFDAPLNLQDTEKNVIINFTAQTESSGSERTLYPGTVSLDKFSKIILSFEGSEHMDDITITSYKDVSIKLSAGEWTIKATGYVNIHLYDEHGNDHGNRSHDKEFEAAIGYTTFNVSKETVVTCNIPLVFGNFDGKKGVLSCNIKIPNGSYSFSLYLIPFHMFINNPAAVGDPIFNSHSSGSHHFSKELDPGTYYLLLKATQNNQNRHAAWSEIAYISSGRETLVDHELFAGDFASADKFTLGGTASISGINRIGQTLKAETEGITGTGINKNFTYQWRAGAEILGTGSTYTIKAADVTKQISCVITHGIVAGTVTTPATGSIPYEIKIEKTGDAAGDALTVNTDHAVSGNITLNYTLANTAANNLLSFTPNTITAVNTAGSGTRTYTINAADATTGIITITGTFIHTAKNTDTIAFTGSTEHKTYGDIPFTKTLTNTGIGSRPITYSSSDTTVATVTDAGLVTILKAGTATITATKDGDITYEEATAHYTLDVAKKGVTITGLTAQNKPYNGNTTATVTGGTITGIINSDTVTILPGTALFADKTAGNGKTVTFTGYSLSGTHAGNYNLSSQPASVTANITAIQLTAGTPTYTAAKTYDGASPTNGTTALTGTVTGGTLTGVISGDTVTRTAAGTYDNANAGTGKTITIVYTIAGADAGNYIKPVNYVATNGVINKATGTTVGAATAARNLTSTYNSVTVGTAAALSSTTSQQSVEYALAVSNTVVPTSGWQDGLIFTTGVNPNTTYYVWARSKESANFAAGTARTSATSTTTANPPAGINITVTDNVTGHEVSFTNGTIAALNAADSRTITVSGSYAAYNWFVDGVKQNAAGNSLIIKGIDFTQGQHQILVVVYQSGSDVPYSKEINFTVNN